MSGDRHGEGDLGAALSFIETQFPVSKLSKESYKERKSNYSQTLTGLGKWRGRKPLVLVRAVILGLLLPATADPRRDREIFLKLMTMDDEGLGQRKSKSIPLREVYARLRVQRFNGRFRHRLPQMSNLYCLAGKPMASPARVG